jgi:pantoate--beta-alanine ligase
MKIVNSIKELKRYLAEEKQNNKRIGFVPTMGALHSGHLSLVKCCVAENDVCVVSIFVNPTQFNDKNDLVTYPRTLEKDCALLEPVGVDYVFAPSEQEMYPEPDTRTFDFGTVSAVMEGARRPGHFNGVAQVVSRLFYIVEPDNAYFGEKDFQQIAVIRAMVNQLNIPVKINACPIIRETDCLALSSRNVPGKSVQDVIDYVVNTINADPVMRVEYFEIVDGITMESIKDWSDTTYAVGCITVYCGEVRLIDNIKYNR